MSDLKEKIEEAWWKIAADNKYGLKIMPTPKHHLNLVGDKQKFLDAAIEAVKVHIEECVKPDTDISILTEYGLGYYHGWDAAMDEYRKALMESLETSD